MVSCEVLVQNAVGLHARPAATLVQVAQGFAAQITVVKGGRHANAKSLLSVLSLGVKAGEQVSVRAEGADEAAAIQAIQTLAASNFGEKRGKGGVSA